LVMVIILMTMSRSINNKGWLNMEGISRGQLERLSFIDFRLYFTGQIGRNDLISRFGIGEAAATRDLSFYRDVAKQNIIYDTTAKVYRISDKYKRHFIKEIPAKDLVRALVHGIGDDLFKSPPEPVVPCDLPSRLHPPHVETFAKISRAIYNRNPIEITYLSKSSGENKRVIIPFAFAGNGLRWHVRAYDRKREKFGDFVVNRITKSKIIQDEEVVDSEQSRYDDQWNTIVELEIVAHPTLEHKEFVEAEHSIKDGVLKHKIRAAMAGYILRLWNVDCSRNEPKQNANEYQLWLKNVAAISEVADINIAPNAT
jgi:hypothetical protein